MADEEKDVKVLEALLVAHKRAVDGRRSHKAEADRLDRVAHEIEEQIDRYLGTASVGTIDSGVVIRRVKTGQFANAQFRQAHPDLYDQVVRMVGKEEVDQKELQRIAPEIYDQFCTTRWYNDLELS